MPNPDGVREVSEEDKARLRAAIPDFTRGDGTINYSGIAAALGRDRSTMRRWVDRYTAENRKAAQEAYTPELATIEDMKPRVRVRAYGANATRDLPVRHVVGIGDLHMRVGMDIDHMRWMGRYVAEHKPDNVVQIGDAFDMESCEFHSPPGSASHAQRPAFIEEIEMGEEAFDAYHSEIGVGEIPHDVVYGNHDYRVWRMEELAPNLAGTLTLRLEQFFARYRWKTTPYRHWLFMEGVGFSHVPHNIMGKPIGGRYPENTIGNQSTHSIVSGHSHRFNHVTIPKIGINNSITVTNMGTAMPHGFIPPYADGATSGWTYGIVDMKLRGGKVEDCALVSMLELERKYGR